MTVELVRISIDRIADASKSLAPSDYRWTEFPCLDLDLSSPYPEHQMFQRSPLYTPSTTSPQTLAYLSPLYLHPDQCLNSLACDDERDKRALWDGQISLSVLSVEWLYISGERML